MTTAALSIPLLHDLQTVVAQHHPDAVLSFGGEAAAMSGLQVLITPRAMYAAWYENVAGTCTRKLKKAGVQIV